MNDSVNIKKGNTIVVVVLTILLVGLAAFICYDKFVKKDETKDCTCEKIECNCEKCDSSNGETCDCTKEITNNTQETEKSDDKNSVKTRICTGTYTGRGATHKDVFTKELKYGNISITLNADGTFDALLEGANSPSGEYIIVGNALMLKITSDLCSPEDECPAVYSSFLDIANDCSQINGGYGSYFFDPNFTLKK